MRPEWLWDRNISVEEIKEILINPEHVRFVEIAALLLSRNNTPKEIFEQYLDRKVFVQNWARIKHRMRKDVWSDPRIIFWQAVYEKLVSKFQENGVKIFARKLRNETNNLSQKIGQILKSLRIEEGLTQNDFAKKLNISQQLISRIEGGRENLSFSTFGKIEKALEGRIHIDVIAARYANKSVYEFPLEIKLGFQLSPSVFSTSSTHSDIVFLKSESSAKSI